MKTACIILGILFACFAYWQRNDIDQYQTNQVITSLWIAGYALTSIVSFITAIRPLPRTFYLFTMILTFLLAALRFPSIEWSGHVLHNENNPAANETGGLLILFLWYTILSMRAHKDQDC